jgi:hypothetical protein
MVKNVVADSPVYAGMDSTSAPINPILSRVGIARATTTLKKKKKEINNSRSTHKENMLEQFSADSRGDSRTHWVVGHPVS